MIPTRLNQQFNRGTVVGFDSNTGSIVVIANTALAVKQYDCDNASTVFAAALTEFPGGYVVPTSRDFNVIVKSAARRTLTLTDIAHRVFERQSCIRRRMFMHLITSDPHVVQQKCVEFRQMFVNRIDNNTTTLTYVLVSERSSYGYLIPFLKINGSNL